jgi:hypothetical protein
MHVRLLPTPLSGSAGGCYGGHPLGFLLGVHGSGAGSGKLDLDLSHILALSLKLDLPTRHLFSYR